MRCPNCDVEIETPQERYIQRQRAKGNCPRCGRQKSDDDRRPDGEEYVNCKKCRVKISARHRRVYLRRGKQKAAR